MTKSLIVVDCQNDFITGSLSCKNADHAVNKIVDFINENPDVDVYYTSDWHSEKNKSFKANGGIWEPHCVAGSWGAEIPDTFNNIKDIKNRPNEKNTYYKGIDDDVEEYSAINARNKDGKVLSNEADGQVMVVGIASEYCVRETALDFKDKGKDVSVIKDLLGFVDREDHEKNIEELSSKISIV